MNTIITGIAATIILGIWTKYQAKLIGALVDAIMAAIGKLEAATGRHAPAGTRQALVSALNAGVAGLNQVATKRFWGAIFNRVRQGKGDEALTMVQDALAKVDWGKAIEGQLSPDAKEIYDWARKELCTDHVRAAVKPALATAHPDDAEAAAVAKVVSDPEALGELVDATVKANKLTQQPHTPETAAAIKANINEQIAATRAKLDAFIKR